MKKFHLFYYISLFAFCIGGLSLVFIPFCDFDETGIKQLLAFFIAGLFWLGNITGIVFMIFTGKICSGIEKKLKKLNSNTFENKKIGLISFFCNKQAKISDTIMFIFIAAVVVLTVCGVQIEAIMIPCIAIMFISFIFHCFFNGKNYKYLTAYREYLKKKGSFKNE